MTLYGIIDKLKMLSLKHPNVNSAEEGNIYELLNGNNEHKYASIVITQNPHTEDETFDYYNLNLFYVDRLLSNLDTNRLQIQSTGKNVLSNVINAFCEEFDAECERIEYHTFTEKFADECSGVYSSITITIPKDITCTEKYWQESWSAPVVSIKNQNKKVEFTENGIYVIDYDATQYTGLGKVEVEVNVADVNGSYDEGYSQGKEDGIEEGYSDGKEDGIAEGYSKGKLDGYNEGKADGYIEGKDEGINEQKAKLETISITENGTYTREDGYNEVIVNIEDTNGSYDEGYNEGYNEGIEEGTSNAGTIIAETAQVLSITENGTYTTQYTTTEDVGREITGYFDDGTPFYDYAHLTNMVFKTDVRLIPGSRIEMWWKPDFNNNQGTYGDGIFSTLQISGDFAILFLKNGKFKSQVGNTERETSITIEDKWYHLELSNENGFIINNEVVVKTFEGDYVNGRYGYINGYNRGGINSANGYFGMVKIDGTTYIPTENGFINYSTNASLTIQKEGGYVFEGLPPFEGNLIRTVNVNVVPKINLAKEGLKLAYSTFKEVPEWADFEGITDMSRMFLSCSSIKTVKLFDTSKVIDMQYAFGSCINLESIPEFHTGNVTNMSYVFQSCSKLITLPQLDTSKVTNMYSMFYGCSELQSVPPLNASSLTNGNMFSYSDLKNLTDFGGLIGLKCSVNGSYAFDKLPNLTYESCINILNGLYDFTGNGETPTSSQGKLKIHQNFLDKLTEDDKNIAISKGWVLQV